LSPFNTSTPTNPILNEQLGSGSELRLRQIEVIHSSNPHDTLSWPIIANAVHECAAVTAKVIGHHCVSGDRVLLAKGLEKLLSADVFEIFIVDDKIWGEHWSSDFAAVGAVADKAGDVAWALGRLKKTLEYCRWIILWKAKWRELKKPSQHKREIGA
jgi:hypothetical protein